MKVLVMPDLHVPYTDMFKVKKIFNFNRTFKADVVLSIGDFFDLYHLSKYVKSLKAESPSAELRRAEGQVRVISRWFPKITMLIGNHEKRLWKRAADAGIHPSHITDILKTVKAPEGWVRPNRTDIIEIDGVMYTHGWLSQRKKHAEFFNKSCVIGHLHSQLGIDYIRRRNRTIFAMCVAMCADTNSIAMDYNEIRYNTSTPGFGYVVDGKPFVEAL